MTDSIPPQGKPAPEDIASEFTELGKSLTSLLRSAWESEERKKLQKEIEAGLTDLSGTLSKAATEFSESPTGQNLKADLKDLRQRVESGEVEAQVRQDVLSALRAANAELKKVASQPPFTSTGKTEDHSDS